MLKILLMQTALNEHPRFVTCLTASTIQRLMTEFMLYCCE